MVLVKMNLDDGAKFIVKDSYRQLLRHIPSYTLFSSIINNMNILYEESIIEKTIEGFDRGNYKISSVFPGIDIEYGGEIKKTIYFFPRPGALIEPDISSRKELEESIRERKKSKSIKYLSIEAMKELAASWSKADEKFKFELSDLINIGDNMACSKKELKDFQDLDLSGLNINSSLSTARTKVDRFEQNDGGKLHYRDELIYNYQKIGDYLIKPFMYFIYDGELKDEIRASINLIGEQGIGGKRSIGFGLFKNIEYVDLDLGFTDKAPYLNLSMVHPKKEEVESIIAYELFKVNGYIYSLNGLGYRKKTIGMMKDGSLTSKKIEGSLTNTRPNSLTIEHEIYTNGKAFSIGLGDIDG